ILVLAPMPAAITPGLEREVEGLRNQGATVLVISGDDDALATFVDNPLDPSRRAPALEAGRRQGAAGASAVRALWKD
ncbi:MAG: patatin-like phospholipase family protein, partial [Acidimicrobiales bacterium]